jgi:hypothetical protein
MLYYTSLLFILNVIHASYVCCYDCEYATIILTATSILHHAKYYDIYKGKKIVYFCDISCVCTIFLMGLYKLYNIENIIGTNYILNLTKLTMFISTLNGISTVFFEKYLNIGNLNWRFFHGIFHILSSISGHLLLINYKNAYPDKCCYLRN